MRIKRKFNKSVLRDLRNGKKRRVKYNEQSILLLPLRSSNVTLGVGDRVLYQDELVYVKKVCKGNYLNRFKVGDKWVGRNRIVAKVKERMQYVNLEHLTGHDVFITCQPEVLDFTSEGIYKLILSGGGKRVELPLPANQVRLRETVGLLKGYLDATKQRVIGWNVKSLFSFVLQKAGQFILPGRILDLKVMEAFLGLDLPCPQTYDEAFERLRNLVQNKGWTALTTYYKKIHYPLISQVIPSVETTYLVHDDYKKKLHAHYDIEGQANGRLKCSNFFANSYNPHTLSVLIKAKLNPPTIDAVDYLYLDYRHMEVSVLQWLSGDPQLAELINSGRDLYEGIWERVTGLKISEVYRNACKAIFLPVVYGQGVASVSKRIKISEKTAAKIIDRFYKTFPVAFAWIKQQQENLDEYQFATDFFGRKRQFLDQQYRVRNFVVQSTASTICLHKLIKLFENTQNKDKIVFHVHDGYGMLVSRRDLIKRASNYASVLEAEEEWYPGLKLKVSCSAGARLDNLRKVNYEQPQTVLL